MSIVVIGHNYYLSLGLIGPLSKGAAESALQIHVLRYNAFVE